MRFVCTSLPINENRMTSGDKSDRGKFSVRGSSNGLDLIDVYLKLIYHGCIKGSGKLTAPGQNSVGGFSQQIFSYRFSSVLQTSIATTYTTLPIWTNSINLKLPTATCCDVSVRTNSGS